MASRTDPLRQEHRQIRSRLAALRVLADNIDDTPAADLVRELKTALTFLQDGLLPHALAEDGVLYPTVALAMGSSQATATMSRDHLEIARLIEQLDHLGRRLGTQTTKRLRRDLRRVLYAIDAIVSLHLDKEEEIYLPLLDAYLTEDTARDLFASLHGTARATAHAPRRVS